jgi:hypothetical protein
VDEKDKEKIVIITIMMRYNSSAYLMLTVTDIDKYAHHSRTRQ